MDLLNNTDLDNKVKKNEVEYVVKEKMEYCLLGTYVISKGFKLFSYNSTNNKVKEIEIKRSDTMSTMFTKEGWIYWDEEMKKTTIDSKLIYFEAFRFKSAINQAHKFKQGKIKELFNLKKPNPNGIDIFSHV